ncbi:MAG: ABC transporter transmembrane domain-containing protein [Balneolaceae bacterium]|nr:ABC transporter transmembrane domain-containing protein [Balneolaceae bacterium]
MMLFAAFLELGGIGMIPAFVAIVAVPDKVLEYQPLEPILLYLNIQTAQDLLIYGSITLVLVFIMKGAYLLFFGYIEALFLNNRRYKISREMMSTYMQAPYTFHLKRNSSELVRNAINEVHIVVNAVISNILKLSREGVITVLILGFLLFYEPIITLIVIGLLGLGAGSFILFTQKKMKQYGEQQVEQRGKMMKAVYEGIGGLKDARILNRENEFINKFSTEALKFTNLNIYTSFIQQIPKPVIEATAVIGMMLISVMMIWQGRPMSAIIPTLSLFAMAVVRIMPAVQTMSSMYTGLQYNIASLDPVYDDLKLLEDETKQFLKDRRNAKKVELKDRIELKGFALQLSGKQ